MFSSYANFVVSMNHLMAKVYIKCRISMQSFPISGWQGLDPREIKLTSRLGLWGLMVMLLLSTSWLVSETLDHLRILNLIKACSKKSSLNFKSFISAGHLTARSDVYGFGVVLLEMLIGKRAMDKSRPSSEHNLVEWARPILNHNKKLLRILDRRIEGQYSPKILVKVANLAYQCLSSNPKGRPLMNQVIEILEPLVTQEMSQQAMIPQSGTITLYEVPKEGCRNQFSGREEKICRELRTY